jgi:predicted DNA-binding WGR domain protein
VDAERRLEMNDVTLRRVDPSRNMSRFYRLAIEADLFGGALLMKQWGRIRKRRKGYSE